MKTLLIILLVVAVVAGVIYTATKVFKAFKDEDNDGIPDVVEDKFEDVKEDVEDAIEDIKEFAEDVKDKAEDIIEEVKDLPKKLSRKKPGRSKNKTNTVKPAPAKNTGGGSSPETGNGDYYRTIRKAEK